MPAPNRVASRLNLARLKKIWVTIYARIIQPVSYEIIQWRRD